MRRPIHILQFLFVAVLTAAILLQGVTGIAKHLPQFDSQPTAHADEHGHSHDPVTDILWSAHGHSHDVADHDHNPVVALITDVPVLTIPRAKEPRSNPALVAWDMKAGLERPPRG